MNGVVKRWIIGICVGVCIPSGVYVVRTYLHRNDKYARTAHTVGVDVDTWADVARTYDKVAQQHTLTSREMDKEQAWISSPKELVRLRALVGLRYCTDPAEHARALSLMRTRLDDTVPIMRVKAITSMKMADDPDLAADVGKLAQDPSKMVRDAAQTALGGTVAGGKSP